jgi:hypothetical protein
MTGQAVAVATWRAELPVPRAHAGDGWPGAIGWIGGALAVAGLAVALGLACWPYHVATTSAEPVLVQNPSTGSLEPTGRVTNEAVTATCIAMRRYVQSDPKQPAACQPHDGARLFGAAGSLAAFAAGLALWTLSGLDVRLHGHAI